MMSKTTRGHYSGQTQYQPRGKFLGCSGFPKCRSIIPLAEDGKTPLPKAVPEVTGYNCDKCNKPMVIKDSRRGKFLGCSGFPKCRNTKPLPDSSSDLINPQEPQEDGVVA